MTLEPFLRAALCCHLLAAGMYCMCRVQDTAAERFAAVGDGERASDVALRSFHVAIDAGGDGTEGSQKGYEMEEMKVASLVANQVAKHLLRRGVQVSFLRASGEYPSAKIRAEKAKALGVDLLLSLRLNENLRLEDVSGVETRYCVDPPESDHAKIRDRLYLRPEQPLQDERGARLALLIQRHLCEETSQRRRGIRTTETELLRSAPCPAVEIALGFVSNPAEARFMDTPGYQEEAGRAIAEAVCGHLLAVSANPNLGLHAGGESGLSQPSG